MIKIIALVVVIGLIGLLGYAWSRPNTFRVQRSARMRAAPDKIFALVHDLHAWSSWSPWEKLDPAMKRTYSGPPQGTGAAYAWEGNGKSGAGRMEILDETSPGRVLIKLDFLEPFEGHNTVEFTMEPAGDSTNVTWVMAGHSAFMHKLFTVFFSMDSLVGKDFDAGLANIKGLVEK